VTPNKWRDRGRVLVIEDDADVIETMAEMLTGLGYHVRTARNTVQALEAVRVALPDVVVLDLLLPGRLGWDLIPLLREQDPGLPVIAMTAASSPDVEHAARAHAAFGYILKPVDLERLDHLLMAALSSRERP
jgi:DNA-binding NtrC family response regulator